MRRITVRNDGQNWVATFHGNAEVKRLFGTDTIPTPFLARASAQDVLREVQTLNPDCEVVLATA